MKISRKQTTKNRRDGHAWERLEVIWYGVGYLLLLICTCGSLYLHEPTSSVLVLILSGCYALWFGVLPWLPIKRGQRFYVPIFCIYMALGMWIWFLLAGHDYLFMLLLASLYPRIYQRLPLMWATIMAVALMLLWVWLATENGRTSLGWSLLIGTMFTVAGSGLAVWIHAVIVQSIERQNLVETLKATRVELARAERRAGKLDERQRLAHEIHDTIAQSLTSVVMHLEAAEGASDQSDDALSNHLTQAKRAAREGLAETRELVSALRPNLMGRLPLEEAGRRLAARWSRSTEITATVSITGTPEPLQPELEVALLQAARELLTNVRKHAHATSVALTLSYMDDRVTLDVQDNGRGFAQRDNDTARQHSGGFGLPAMRERMTRLGGGMVVESAPGDGTTVALSLPLCPEESSLRADQLVEGSL